MGHENAEGTHYQRIVLDDDRLKQGKQVFGKDYFDDPLDLSSLKLYFKGVCGKDAI